MIKYNLKCNNNHEFESWFSDSKEFNKLKKKNLLECIYCNSKKISKSIMAPMISVGNKKEAIPNISHETSRAVKDLLKIQNYVKKNFEYVGNKFSKKVREIYYDKKSKKKIYGTTTPREREELVDEGIDLLSVPWVEKDN